MKVAILAGGLGSRIDPDGQGLPKALVPIGDRPILWHIMAHFAAHGLSDFVVALGHKKAAIEAWFRERAETEEGDEGDRLLSLGGMPGGGWRVRLVDTGLPTATGGRIKRLGPCLGKDIFILTYCDGLTDLDPARLLAFHEGHGRLATVTAVHPPSSFGHMELEGDRVTAFAEKPEQRQRWINGAYFVLAPDVLERIDGDESQWETKPLETLTREGELMAYRHEGFWQCMDTEMQRLYLEDLWRSGQAPWKSWV